MAGKEYSTRRCKGGMASFGHGEFLPFSGDAVGGGQGNWALGPVHWWFVGQGDKAGSEGLLGKGSSRAARKGTEPLRATTFACLEHRG